VSVAFKLKSVIYYYSCMVERNENLKTVHYLFTLLLKNGLLHYTSLMMLMSIGFFSPSKQYTGIHKNQLLLLHQPLDSQHSVTFAVV